MSNVKVLVAGWFSFEEMGATGGDLMVRDVVCEWLKEVGVPFDIATAPPFKDGVAWQTASPTDYSHVCFVCGPFGNGWPVTDFLTRFDECKKVGVNLSMIEDVSEWNPFSLLLERDSNERARPDLSFAAESPLVPVIGVAFVPDQNLPGAKNRQANAAILDFLDSVEAPVVQIDTRLDVTNSTGLDTPAEIESLIAAVDVMMTTRLHGTVLALRNEVPVIPVDPISGGHKLSRQVKSIGWPILFNVDDLDPVRLREALEWCLNPDAKTVARECTQRALAEIEESRSAFQAFFSLSGDPQE